MKAIYECNNCYEEYSLEQLKTTWDIDPESMTCAPNEKIKICPNCGEPLFYINIVEE